MAWHAPGLANVQPRSDCTCREVQARSRCEHFGTAFSFGSSGNNVCSRCDCRPDYDTIASGSRELYHHYGVCSAWHWRTRHDRSRLAGLDGWDLCIRSRLDFSNDI